VGYFKVAIRDFFQKAQGIFYSVGKTNGINGLLAMNDDSTFQACMVPACPG
jgi:hypothetical protein